ncbi:EAL domain-containing protein [Paramagnetospirillum magneticum]|uniref:Predicted signal transduction protein containing a membrane domain n=1 Tax=Paramagnetospirillum magneticum (strain ATCC 700264 / AMB-1) TaxID=342108 RepID=Q2W2M8_PARM1|nr:EAL domain-containing protein [Paramagnetospirillum magneticum]BAE51897.1 Predicted signal transduction protein containing a membrane domain [Paramagnetospirillum magneticum AMB-1]
MLTRDVAAGEVIFRQGEAAEVAYLIEAGTIRIQQEIGGETRPLARLGPGEVFGELGVIDGAPRSATALAETPARLVMVRGDKIQQSIARSDPFFAELMRKLVGRLRQSRAADDSDVMAALQSSDFGPGYEEILRERDIAEGIIRGEIEPFLQPIVDLRTGAIKGYETLARWRSEKFGLMTPCAFLPLARRTGLIRRIDLTMADRALNICAGFGTGENAPFVAINVSAWHLRDRTLVDTLKRMLEQHGLPPRRICVEITETMLIDETSDADSMLAELRDCGIRVALDDFGTGFSPLAFLYRLPIDILKIDGSLVEGIEASPRQRDVLEGMRELCARLGIDVIVEGIETEDTTRILLELGFTLGQGTRFAAPGAVDETLKRRVS